MALEKFRAAPLPNPGKDYDPQYIRQLVRVLENYFSQLDSVTANYAQSYRANYFYSTPTTVATLASAATAGSGARAFVNDATATTFASIVAGGGANPVPIYSDGTNWRIG